MLGAWALGSRGRREGFGFDQGLFGLRASVALQLRLQL